MTTREWFRGARLAYRPATDYERALLGSLKEGDWVMAEFWTLLILSHLRARAAEAHLWWLDNYTWRCAACPATVMSDEIGETSPPPNAFSTECKCPACLPCPGEVIQ